VRSFDVSDLSVLVRIIMVSECGVINVDRV
jgi:hypothetical protein